MQTTFLFLLKIVLQTYQDRPQLSSTQFFDLLTNIHQTLNEALAGGEKFDELLKYIENQQSQVLITQEILHFYLKISFS